MIGWNETGITVIARSLHIHVDQILPRKIHSAPKIKNRATAKRIIPFVAALILLVRRRCRPLILDQLR
jgi:hypothetical protein